MNTTEIIKLKPRTKVAQQVLRRINGKAEIIAMRKNRWGTIVTAIHPEGCFEAYLLSVGGKVIQAPELRKIYNIEIYFYSDNLTMVTILENVQCDN